jgi:hypothetical protein
MDILNKPVEDLGLSVRALNVFRVEGINTVADLVRKTDNELMYMRNMGAGTLKEIRKALRAHELTLNMVDAEKSKNTAFTKKMTEKIYTELVSKEINVSTREAFSCALNATLAFIEYWDEIKI